jgi:hypothetical protein
VPPHLLIQPPRMDFPISGHRLTAGALNQVMGRKTPENSFICRGQSAQRLYSLYTDGDGRRTGLDVFHSRSSLSSINIFLALHRMSMRLWQVFGLRILQTFVVWSRHRVWPLKKGIPWRKGTRFAFFFIFLFSFGLNVSHGNTIAPYVY